MNAVDTNILIYTHDSREPTKKAKASALLASLTDGVLLWQVACEYVAAIRKLEPLGYSSLDALADVGDMRSSWTTKLPTWKVMERAQNLIERYSLSYWDAMIVAACLEAGVKAALFGRFR